MKDLNEIESAPRVTSNDITTPRQVKPSNKRKAKPVVEELDDETILANITTATKAALKSEGTLREAVIRAAKEDLDRDDVVAAIVEGGRTESWARSLVSEVYVSAGKRERKAGGGRKVDPAHKAIADIVLAECGGKLDEAIKASLAVNRILKALKKDAPADNTAK